MTLSIVRPPLRKAADRSRSRGSNARREAFTGIVFVLPVFLIFVLFRFLPIAGAVGMSLVRYRLNGDIAFLGTANYHRLFGDDLFWHALVVTLLYVVIFVPLILVVSMVGALLLNALKRTEGLFRALLFLPYVTSFVLAGIIWTWLFAADGPIDTLLKKFHLPVLGFLSGGQLLVLASLAVVSVWKGFGYSMLIMLAGLKAQSAEIHEAARVDGASWWRTFWYITLPMLKPVIFFVVVIESISAFQVFDTMYVMTGGGPARESYSLIYFLYDEGFRFFDFGYAAAIGMVVFVIVLILSLIQRRFFERKERA